MVCAKAIVVLMVSMVSMVSEPTKNRGAALSRRIHARLDASTRVDLRWRRFYRGGRAVTHESGTCRGRVMAGSDVRLMSAESRTREAVRIAAVVENAAERIDRAPGSPR